MKLSKLLLAALLSLCVVIAGLVAAVGYRNSIGINAFTSQATATPQLLLTEADVRDAQTLKTTLERRFSSFDITEVVTHDGAVIIAAFVGSPARNREQTAQTFLDVARDTLIGTSAMRVILGDDSGQVTQYDWSIFADGWRVDAG